VTEKRNGAPDAVQNPGKHPTGFFLPPQAGRAQREEREKNQDGGMTAGEIFIPNRFRWLIWQIVESYPFACLGGERGAETENRTAHPANRRLDRRGATMRVCCESHPLPPSVCPTGIICRRGQI